jgi:chromate transport protein ChrA
VWAKIGRLGFGGPAGQIALMHRELAEQRWWISDERFLHALSAVCLGRLMRRTLSGVILDTASIGIVGRMGGRQAFPRRSALQRLRKETI